MGIGVTEDGLDALPALLSRVPADTGMAFLVVPHVASRLPRSLTVSLRKATPMVVSEVTPASALAPDRVYVLPQDGELVLREGVLEERPPAEGAKGPSIDALLVSLAEDRGHRAIGVVLTATAAAGIEGLRAIRAAGGITFGYPGPALDPDVPWSALAATAIDRVLAAEDLGADLARLARHPYVRRPSEPASISDEEGALLEGIHDLLRSRTGIDLGGFRPDMLRRRIARRMAVNRIERLGDYLLLLHGDSPEARALCDDMLLRVAGFFRDPPLFEALAMRVLPALSDQGDGSIRIWVPGCSTGEEVYSIAMVAAEVLGEERFGSSFQIFGSDRSEAAVKYARGARYPEAIARDVGAARLGRFFTKIDGGYQVHPHVRERCVFVPHDVTRDPPFNRLDLISGRDVVGQLSAGLIGKVVPLFHFVLKPEGFLLLGPADSIGAHPHLFELWDSVNRIYRRRPGASGVVELLPARSGEPARPRRPPAATPESAPTLNELQRVADRVLQARYGPPAVVVNEELDVISVRGRVGAYLELSSGTPSLNLVTMAREGLLADLRLALRRAKKEGVAVYRDAPHVRIDGERRPVRIAISPLQLPRQRERCFLVVFEELPRAPGPAAGARRKPARRAETGGAQQPRGELDGTWSYLRAIIEDQSTTNEDLTASNESLAAANEELMSANEELQCLNEELETAKEELQSVNGELSIVNTEIELRNAELLQLNNDLLNVMASIEVPIVLLGLDRRIRRFTPEAGRRLGLIASDVDRPIGDLNFNLQGPDLEEAIDRVIGTLEVEEAEVRDVSGRWYRLQIRPYRTPEDKIDGAVVSLVDIDAPRRALEERDRLLEQLSRETAATARLDRDQRLLAETAMLLGDILELENTLGRAARLVVPRFADLCIVDLVEDDRTRLAAVAHAEPEQEKHALSLAARLPPEPHLEHGAGHAIRTRRSEIHPPLDGAEGPLSDAHPVILRELGARSYICVPLVARDRVVGVLSLIRGERSPGFDTQSLWLAEQLGRRFEIAIDNARLHATTVEAVSARNEFFSIAAHELRTPMAALLLQVQTMRLLAERDRTAADDAQMKRLALVERQTQRLDQLVTTLLDVSRIAMGRFELDWSDVELAALVQEVAARFEAQARSAGCELSVRLEGPLHGRWDRMRLEQVVTNLIANALKYGARKPVEVRLETDGTVARLIVEDHGIGIAREDLERIFERFERAVPARHYAGLGMGLFITRQIVVAHGGAIGARSQLGEGATFTVDLPISPGRDDGDELGSRQE